MHTLTPFLANALHAMTPAGPAPMISTSTWLSNGNMMWRHYADVKSTKIGRIYRRAGKPPARSGVYADRVRPSLGGVTLDGR